MRPVSSTWEQPCARMLSRNSHQDCLSNGQIKQNLAEQYHQLCKQVQVVQVEPCSLTKKKKKRKKKKEKEKKMDTGFQNQEVKEFSPHLLLGAEDQWLGSEQYQLVCGSTGTSSSNCQETELARFANSGMSHATTASPKPPSWTHWKVDDTVVGRRNVWWTTTKSGHSCQCQNCWLWTPAEKTTKDFLLNRLLCSQTTQSVKGLN